jgi:hypothetical protein
MTIDTNKYGNIYDVIYIDMQNYYIITNINLLYNLTIINNIFYYNFFEEQIIFNNITGLFYIIDNYHKRIIYGDYIINNYNITFFNVNSINVLIDNKNILINNNNILIINTNLKIYTYSNNNYIYTKSIDNITVFQDCILINNKLVCFNNTNLIIYNDILSNTKNLKYNILDLDNSLKYKLYYINDQYFLLEYDEIRKISKLLTLNLKKVDNNELTTTIFLGNNNNNNNYVIPYNIKYINLNINNIQTINNDIIIYDKDTQNIYYNFDDLIFKLNLNNIKFITISNNILYLLDNINHNIITYDFTNFGYLNYNIYNYTFDENNYINMYSMNNILLNFIVFHDKYNIYIYQLNDSECLNIPFIYINDDEIISISFILTNDNYNLMYVTYKDKITIYELKYDIILNTFSIISTIPYIIPYNYLSVINNITEYKKDSNIAYIYLFNIKKYNNYYKQLLLGNVKNIIDVNTLQLSNIFDNIYNIKYTYIDKTWYYNTNNINKNYYICLDLNDESVMAQRHQSVYYSYIFNFVFLNKEIINLNNDNLIINNFKITNNNFNLIADFINEIDTIEIYMNKKIIVEYYSTNNIYNYYINNNLLLYLTYSNIDDKTNKKYISINYLFGLDNNNSKVSLIEYIIINNNKIKLNDIIYINKDINKYIFNNNNYDILIYHYTGNYYINIINSGRLYLNNIYLDILLTYKNYIVYNTASYISINYSINTELGAIIIDNNYKYIKSNNNYYICKYENNVLKIYYKLYNKINWQYDNGNFYIQNLKQSNINSLNVYNNYYNDNIDKITENDIINNYTIYNCDLIILDYINYFNNNNFLITNNNVIDSKINRIINDLYSNQRDILNECEYIINNSSIYNDLINYNISNTTNILDISNNYYNLYLKQSNNLNNMVNYKIINSEISIKIEYLFFKEYYELIDKLYNYNDDIICKIKLNNNIINTNKINLIYLYIKELIIISNNVTKYNDFINNNLNNNSYYLKNNINNIINIYNNLVNINLINWDFVEHIIIILYNSINLISLILHQKIIINNNIKYLLINNNFSINCNLNINTIYLEQLNDDTILNYLNLYLNTLYLKYPFYNILSSYQEVIDDYFTTLNNIFTNNIGVTTQYYIDQISVNYNINISDYIKNYNIKFSNTNNKLLVLPNTYNIDTSEIEQYLNNKNKISNDFYNYYINNKNILSISNLDFITIKNNFTIFNKNHNDPIILSNNSNIITVDYIKNIKINDYINIEVLSDYNYNYQSFKVISINYLTKCITLDASLDVIYKVNSYIKINNNNFIYSSIDLSVALCNIIFNNFEEKINNNNFESNQYWYYMSNNEYIYFTSINNDINYDNYILSNINNNYKITDIKNLRNSFNKIFSSQNEIFTINNNIYQLCELLNTNRSNSFYQILYILYKLNNFINMYKFNFDNYVNLFNIDYILNSNKKIKDQLLLLLNNNNKNTINSKYYYILLKKISIINNNTNKLTSIENLQKLLIGVNIIDDIEILICDDYINDYIYPYLNSDINNNFNNNILLQNKTITYEKKFNDIYKIVSRILYYYNRINNNNYYNIEIKFIQKYDNDKRFIAFNKILNILKLQNNIIFDLFNSSAQDQSASGLLYFYRDTLISEIERIGYIKLKCLSIILWKFLSLDTNYYDKNILLANDESIVVINNLYNKIYTQISDIDNFNTMFNKVLYPDINYKSIWNIFISKAWERSSTKLDCAINLNDDKYSNLVSPFNYFFIAYLINNLINLNINFLKENNIFIYPANTEYYDIYNFNIGKYTNNAINFLIKQKNKFIIEEWDGNIDVFDKDNNIINIAKIYLCNNINLINCLYNTVNEQNNTTMSQHLGGDNSDIKQILKRLLFTIDITCGYDDTQYIMSISIYFINYILLIFLRKTNNQIESYDIYNNKIIYRYSTLYLINGFLKRITDLPDYYYYDINNNYITINRTLLVYNNIVYYNIIQNSIYIIQEFIINRVKDYYNSYNNLTNKLLNIDLNNILLKDNNENTYFYFNYKINRINNIDNKLKLKIEVNYNNGNNFILNKSYIYLKHNTSIYYCFVENIVINNIYVDLAINNILYSDFINIYNIIKNDCISVILYGGIYNIINNIYDNNKTKYISSNHILDNYNDYNEISNFFKNLLSTYLNDDLYLHTLAGHSSWVLSAIIMKDGTLLTTGADKTIKFWTE